MLKSSIPPLIGIIRHFQPLLRVIVIYHTNSLIPLFHWWMQLARYLILWIFIWKLAGQAGKNIKLWHFSRWWTGCCCVVDLFTSNGKLLWIYNLWRLSEDATASNTDSAWCFEFFEGPGKVVEVKRNVGRGSFPPPPTANPCDPSFISGIDQLIRFVFQLKKLFFRTIHVFLRTMSRMNVIAWRASWMRCRRNRYGGVVLH